MVPGPSSDRVVMAQVLVYRYKAGDGISSNSNGYLVSTAGIPTNQRITSCPLAGEHVAMVHDWQQPNCGVRKQSGNEPQLHSTLFMTIVLVHSCMSGNGGTP